MKFKIKKIQNFEINVHFLILPKNHNLAITPLCKRHEDQQKDKNNYKLYLQTKNDLKIKKLNAPAAKLN